MLTKDLLIEAVSRALLKAVTDVPEDVKNAFKSCIENERSDIARVHLGKTLENISTAAERNALVCPDTGWPMFFVKLGDQVEIEGGFSAFNKIFIESVEGLSKIGMLRPTMVHPLTRVTSITNVGSYIPYVEFKPISADYIEITAVPKGGGAEIFIQAPLRILLLADGIVGIKKFVVDSVMSGAIDGKTCPPNVVGVGVGGTSDLCMKLAKQAAVLRPIGDRHPDAQIAGLEIELLNAINSLNIGPMGCGGQFAAFDVHIEYAHTHTAATPVAVNVHCSLCRRATVRLYADGRVEDRKSPDWFDR